MLINSKFMTLVIVTSILMVFTLLSANLSYAQCAIHNYIGTSIQSFSMKLSDSKAKWTPYSIGYQGQGNIPESWSAWNVNDSDGQYFGTITLECTNGVASLNNYSATGSQGRYFTGIAVNNNNVTVGSVITPSNKAKVANYIGTKANGIIMVLNKTGGGWKPFSINYQGTGEMPCGGTTGWSNWNFKDTAGNYFGNATITCKTPTDVSLINYKGSSDGKYFDGIKITNNDGVWGVTVTKIHGAAGGDGPFPKAPIATPSKYRLCVKGKNIHKVLANDFQCETAKDSNLVILKGVVRPSLEWAEQGQFLSPEDIALMANKWNANLIRLDMSEYYWLKSEPKTKKGSYKQIVDAIIHYATANNMAVILDLHWTTKASQSNMANKEAEGLSSGTAMDFWAQIATEYKDFGTVMFELFNEPVNISKDVWLNGSDEYAGFQELYDTVRGTGAQNITIIGGLSYAWDLSFVNDNFKVEGKNIVYNSHPYNHMNSSDYDQLNYVVNNYPLIFTEFGSNQPKYFPPQGNQYVDIYKIALEYANTNKVHYSGFSWFVNQDNLAMPVLINSWTTANPAGGGVFVYNDMTSGPNPPTPLNLQKNLANGQSK